MPDLTTCPDCERPCATELGKPGVECSRSLTFRYPGLVEFANADCQSVTIVRLRSRVAELERIALAWDALARHAAMTDATVSRPWIIVNGRWRMSCSAIIAEAASPHEVAIDLAVKLGLLPKEGT